MTISRNWILTLSATAAGLTLAGAAMAHGHRGWHGGHRAEQMDTNKDGIATLVEVDAYFAGKATEIDANKDGQITSAEVEAYHAAQRAQRKAARFAKLDSNGDGRVSTEEFAATASQRVMHGDRDGDGDLDRDDRSMHHGRRAEH